MGEGIPLQMSCRGGYVTLLCDLAHGQMTQNLETHQCLFLAPDTALELKM